MEIDCLSKGIITIQLRTSPIIFSGTSLPDGMSRPYEEIILG